MNIYFMANTLGVENGHFWVHKNNAFSKGINTKFSPSIILTAPHLQSNTTKNLQSLVQQTSLSLHLEVQIKMFSLKKWG